MEGKQTQNIQQLCDHSKRSSVHITEISHKGKTENRENIFAEIVAESFLKTDNN